MANKKQFTLVFDATMNVGEVKKSISEMQKALNGVNLSKGLSSSVADTFKKLLDELDNYEAVTSQVATSMNDIKKADKSLQTILSLFEKINNVAKEIGADPINFVNQEDLKKISAAKKALEGAKNALSNTAIAAKKANLQQQFDAAKKKVDGLSDQISELNKEVEGKKNKKIVLSGQLQEAKDKLSELKKELNNLQSNPIKAKTKTSTKDGVRTTETLNADELEDYKNKVADTKRKIDEVRESIEQLNKDISATDSTKAEKEIADLDKKSKEATDSMNALGEKIRHLKKNTKTETVEKLRNELADLTGLAKKDIPATIDGIENFIQALEEVKKTEIQKVLDQLNKELEETGRQGKTAGEGLNRTAEEAEELSRTAQDIENLKNQILDFFSISNSIELFKRAINSAIDTVKELDAVMTETAVVTEFDIGDMWDKLPQYSSEASKLGASISDLYSATTLYYQQGLKTNAAMGVGVETMKMARVANMNAEAATTAMTAALRGFNMEVNELNAQRVNDVYSELAAITAADTSQIATAMGKTASIAASANMEFETTAALLAQIIETTQEAPETAGTALKTIIARFSEVKSLQNQGLSTGKDAEGEDIDVNKIQTALRTVGISMDEFFVGTEGLDSVLLRLAEKWDELDFTTQRYIATTAAGSRQQSRFIAMMSNYERTTELVSAANDSAGASQKQFNKTLESLDAKLQKLENAWKSFVMGIANDEFVKAGVDALTWILESINKLTDALSGGNGLIKSIVSLGVAWSGLKIGKNIFETFLPKMLSNFATGDPNSVVDKVINLFDKSKKEDKMGMGSILGNFFEKIGNNYGPQQVVDKLSQKVSNLGEIFQDTGGKAVNFWSQLKGNEKFGTQLKGAVNTAVYIAAITLIVSGITSIAKAWEDAKNANDKAIEDMEKSSEEFASQLQEAKQELAAITNERDDLRELQKELDGLAKGTDEWKKKLVEANSAVLDLLDKYPELAAYVTQTNGALSISEAGWGVITESALQKQQIAAAGQSAARIRRTEAEEQKTLEESQSGFAKAAYQMDEFIGSNEHIKGRASIGGGVGALAGSALLGAGLTAKFAALGTLAGPLGTLAGAVIGAALGAAVSAAGAKFADGVDADEDAITKRATGLNKNDYMSFAAAAAEKGMGYAAGTTYGEYHKLFKSMGLEGDFNKLHNNIIRMGADFDKLSASALKLENTQSTYIDSLVSQIAGENDKVSDSKYREQVEELVSSTNDNYGERLDEAAQKITDNRDYVTKKGEATEGLITEYANLMGLQKDEVRAKIANSSLSVETMATALAQQNLGEEISEELTKTLEKIPKDNEKILNILSREGRKVTQENLKGINLDELKNAETIELRNEKMAELFGITLDAEQWQVVFDNLSASVERFEAATALFADVTGVDLANYEQLNKLDSETLNTLVGNLQGVAVAQGAEAANSVAQGLNTLLSGITNEEDLNTITNILDTIDWTNIDEVHGLSEKIQSLGLKSNITKEKIDAFEVTMIQATKAVKKFSMEKVLEELAKTEGLEADLREREPNNMVFTAEQVKDYLDIDPDLAKDFYQTGSDQYVYMGDTLEALNQALWENRKAILDNTAALNGRKRAEVIDKIQDEGFNLKTVTLTPEAITTYEQYVSPEDYDTPAAYVGAAIGSWISHGSLGYEKVIGTKYTNEWGNEQSDVKNILTKLANGEVLISDENDPTKLETGKSYLSREDAERIFKALNPNGDVSSLDDEQLRQEIIKLVNSTGTQQDYDKLFQLMRSSLNPTSLLQSDTNFTNLENNKKLIEDLKAQARAAHVSEAFIQEFEKALADNEGILTVEIAAILANAIESETTEKSIQQAAKYANDIFSKYNDINQMTDEDISNIGLAFNFEEMYTGGEGFIFIKDQLENIEKALKGDTKALEQFQNALASTKGLILRDGLIDIWNLTDGQGRVDNGTVELVNELLETGLFKIQTVVAEQAGEYYTALIDETGKVWGYDFKYLEAGDSYTTLAAANNLDWMNALGNYNGDDFQWENPYDKFYNSVQKINAELRERERLERAYQRLINRPGATVGDILQNRRDRLDSLANEKSWRETLRGNRLDQITQLEKEYSQFGEYAGYNEENGTVWIDWEKINKLEQSGSEEQVEALQEYISKLEELQGEVQQETDAIEEIEDITYDIYQEGKDEYFELENQIKDALVEARQKEIDKLTAIDNSINDTNSKILSSMQEAIASRRQERENEKTEQELTDKRRRLAYLQMDTSNANDLEILKLQEEIEQGEQDYTDQLVDQKISELQEQNDKAAEQRQRQIEILEAQLDYYQKYDVWEDVGRYIEELRTNGGNITQTSLAEILENTEGYKTLSELQKKNWFEDIQRAINGAISWMELNNIPVPSGTPKYASGGLANFTGPAWLDGTKSRPEYVLNASQTQAFLSLVDVLEHFGHGLGNTSTENFGDNIIDIDINIETVKEEADVDMLAEKIEQSIVRSARYRNNNFVQR